MRIARVEWETREIPLKQPFTIAYHTATDAHVLLLRVLTDGPHSGLGSAVPFARVTGEDADSIEARVRGGALDALNGCEVASPWHGGRLLAEVLPESSALRAAVGMALFDLWGKEQGRPVVELLGRVQRRLLTSMTLGIRTLEESRDEAREFLAMGYRILKVKGGSDPEYDVELLTMLRREFPDTLLRVDLNTGYTLEQFRQFVDRAGALEIELYEQPLPREAMHELGALPEELRRVIAADESCVDAPDALALAHPPCPAGILNIKLMKCGGMLDARKIVTIAETAGLELMWGCNIESVISLSAALHCALASPATRYLDLDGDYDLVEDPACGGIVFEDGYLSCSGAPGLGVQLR